MFYFDWAFVLGFHYCAFATVPPVTGSSSEFAGGGLFEGYHEEVSPVFSHRLGCSWDPEGEVGT